MRQITSAFWLCALTANSGAAKNLRSENNLVAVGGLGYTDYCFGTPGHGMALRTYNQDGQTDAVLNAISNCGQTVNASACPSNPQETTLCLWDEEDHPGSQLDIAALTTDQTDPELIACTEPKAKSYCADSTPSSVVSIAIGASVALLAVISGALAAGYYKCPRSQTSSANFFGKRTETTPLLEEKDKQEAAASPTQLAA